MQIVLKQEVPRGKKEVGCFRIRIRITTEHSGQYLVVLFSSQSLLLCWLPHSLWILDYAWHEMARGALEMMLVTPRELMAWSKI